MIGSPVAYFHLAQDACRLLASGYIGIDVKTRMKVEPRSSEATLWIVCFPVLDETQPLEELPVARVYLLLSRGVRLCGVEDATIGLLEKLFPARRTIAASVEEEAIPKLGERRDVAAIGSALRELAEAGIKVTLDEISLGEEATRFYGTVTGAAPEEREDDFLPSLPAPWDAAVKLRWVVLEEVVRAKLAGIRADASIQQLTLNPDNNRIEVIVRAVEQRTGSVLGGTVDVTVHVTMDVLAYVTPFARLSHLYGSVAFQRVLDEQVSVDIEPDILDPAEPAVQELIEHFLQAARAWTEPSRFDRDEPLFRLAGFARMRPSVVMNGLAVLLKQT